MFLNKTFLPSGGRTLRTGLLALCLLLPTLSRAEVLGNLDVKLAGDKAEISVKFNLVVRYLRHSPTTETDTVRISILANPLDLSKFQDQDREYRKSPPKSQVTPFTVTYLARDSSLLIKFKRPVTFNVEGGDDQRSIHIIVNRPAPKSAAKTGTVPAVTPPAVPEPGPGPAEQPVAGVQPESPAAPAAAAPPETTPSTTTAPAAPAVATTPPTEPPGPARKPDMTIAASPEIAAQAASMLAEGKKALDDGNVGAAIQIINKVLNLPPNPSSQDAQELIGLAREKASDLNKARAEYELYLKLYPTGPGADRVKQRLAALNAGKVPPRPRLLRRERDRLHKWKSSRWCAASTAACRSSITRVRPRSIR